MARTKTYIPPDATTPALSDRRSAKLQARFRALGPAITSTLELCLAGDSTIKAESQPSTTPLSDKQTATFVKMRGHDRVAAVSHITNLIKRTEEEEWAGKTIVQRVQVVVDGYDEKVKEREYTKRIQCGKREFPEQYDRTADLMWVAGECANFLEPSAEKRKKKGLALELPRGGGLYVGGGDSDEGDDDEGPIPDEIKVAVKKEEGEDGLRDDQDQAEEGEDDDEFLKAEKKFEEAKAKLESLMKRKTPAPEHPKAAKKARLQSGREGASVGDEAWAARDTNIYEAVSRSTVISSVSRAKRDRAVGWPWSKSRRAAVVVDGENGVKKT